MGERKKPPIEIIARGTVPTGSGFTGNVKRIPEVTDGESPLEVLLAVRNTETGERFDYLDECKDFFDPLFMKDMAEAVSVAYESIKAGENTGIFIHDDMDGFCSAVILKKGFQAVVDKTCSPSEAIVYVPNCIDEGHGLTVKALEYFKDRDVSLIVTADIGITNHEVVKIAKEQGFRVIITDHHKISDGLPPADAVVDPWRGGYPDRILCGAGVAWKFIKALFSKAEVTDMDEILLPFVALGTLADLSPLTGENRLIVQLGLRYLNDGNVPILTQVVKRLGFGKFPVDERDILSSIVPLMNAGISENGSNPSFILLNSDKIDIELFNRLRTLNHTRRKEIDEAYRIAMQQVNLDDAVRRGFIAVWHSEIKPSTPGAIAGRLVEDFGMPVMVVAKDGDRAMGEVRAGTDMDWVLALSEASNLFYSYGGHPKAAGFSAPWSAVREIVSAVTGYFFRFGSVKPLKIIEVDARINLGSFTRENIDSLSQLKPFGPGNPVPAFLHTGRIGISDEESVSFMGKRGLRVEATGLLCGVGDENTRKNLIEKSASGDSLNVICIIDSAASPFDLDIVAEF